MANLLIKGATSGTTTMAAVDNITATITLPATTGVFPIQDSATGALYLPSGTTAQRPGTPATGQWRYNTDLGILEYYNGSAWYSVTRVPTPATSVEYLVVAGGGAGGYGAGSGSNAGGGGAGGYKTGTLAVATGVALTVTVGAGGNQQTTPSFSGDNGFDSEFSTILCKGGGGGGGGTSNATERGGVYGGSGGGAGQYASTTLGTPGTATPVGQGNNGGSAFSGSGGAGGGGGAGAVGGNASSGNGGIGGVGLANSISGSSTYYAGGGGGSYVGGTMGSGGTGGGGTAGNTGPTAGTANTGGGGGGGGSVAGQKGGSGIVIIRYADTYDAATATTGSPTITVAGGYRVYKWTGSGSITF
jgi:hypothetical protein